jgi:hypothetical protein
MADAAARTQMLDTISLLNAGYDPEGFSQDMPGATPRTPFDTQMVGTRKFTRAMSPRQMKHMEDVQDEQAKTRAKRLDASLKPAANVPLRYTEGETGINVFNPNTGESTNQLYAPGFKPKKPAERVGKAEPSDAEKRRLGKQYLASQARNPALMSALQTTFANEPELAEDPALLAYDIMMSKVITKVGAGKGYTPPKSSESMSEADKILAGIKEEIERRKNKGATAPTPTPAAPAAAPAKTPTPPNKEAELSGRAQRKINEIQSSDLTPEEKQEKVQQVNAILAREIMKIRGQG